MVVDERKWGDSYQERKSILSGQAVLAMQQRQRLARSQEGSIVPLANTQIQLDGTTPKIGQVLTLSNMRPNSHLNFLPLRARLHIQLPRREVREFRRCQNIFVSLNVVMTKERGDTHHSE